MFQIINLKICSFLNLSCNDSCISGSPSINMIASLHNKVTEPSKGTSSLGLSIDGYTKPTKQLKVDSLS